MALWMSFLEPMSATCRRQARLWGMPCRPRAWPSSRAPDGGCCGGDRPWPARRPRYQALGRACSSAWTTHGCTGRGGRFAWQPIPALIPAFFRAGAGFSETSRAPNASIGAGLRGAVGCRDTHLGLVDHRDSGSWCPPPRHFACVDCIQGSARWRRLVVRGTHSSPSSTSSEARSSARALASVSRHSSSGTESATTPAAACTYSVPSLTMAVRIAIATSMSPA